VVYEEVDDEEEDDNEDGPEDFKKLTKTEAKLLATELLNDRLEPLNRPNDTNWLNIVSTLDVISENLSQQLRMNFCINSASR
jgi:hypothetical protein